MLSLRRLREMPGLRRVFGIAAVTGALLLLPPGSQSRAAEPADDNILMVSYKHY